MKRCKRLLSGILIFLMVFALSACLTPEEKKDILDEASIMAWERVSDLMRETSPSVAMIFIYQDKDYAVLDSSGSGFFISWQNKIYIISAGHLAEDFESVKQDFYYKAIWKDVAFESENNLAPQKYCEFPIHLVYYVSIKTGDFSVFSFDEKDINFSPKPLKLGDSTKLQSGDWVIAIGAPSEVYPHYTVGTISYFNYPIDWGEGMVFYMAHSAFISGGNSGGPLINLLGGEVVGINLANVPSASLSFARTSDVIKKYLTDFLGPDNLINQ